MAMIRFRLGYRLCLYVLLAGCSPGNQATNAGESPSTSPSTPAPTPSPPSTPSPTPTPSPGTACNTSSGTYVGSRGGAISVQNIAEITFPANSLPDCTLVEVRLVHEKIDNDEIKFIGDLLKTNSFNSEYLELMISGAQPMLGTQISMTVPSSYLSDSARPRVFGLISVESDLERSYESWDAVYGIINSADGTYNFTAETKFFSQETEGKFIGKFVIGKKS